MVDAKVSLFRHLAANPVARIAVATGACALVCMSYARAEIDEPVTRVSDITETTAVQWTSYGFRLQVRLGYQDWEGLDGVPSATGIDINLEPAWRLSHSWSLGMDLDYTVLMGNMSGLRLSVGLAPTWHPTDGLQVALTLGYAAMLASWQYDTPTNTAGLATQGSCDGQGALSKLRLGYMFEMSDNWSTGPAVAASLTWVRCKSVSSTSIDDDANSAPWLDPWWQYDLHAMWAIAWR